MNAAGKSKAPSGKGGPIFCFATTVAFVSLALTTSCSTMQAGNGLKVRPAIILSMTTSTSSLQVFTFPAPRLSKI